MTLPKFYGDLLAEVKQPGLLMLAPAVPRRRQGRRPDPAQGHVHASLKWRARRSPASTCRPQDRETVLFLIRRHLDLSAAMQSRDVFDPQTIRDMAHQVGTVERLKALTLMTYADISAVNPVAMTPWRAEQLWQLYLMVYNELTRELRSRAHRSAARPDPPERIAFLAGFPTRYLRTHTEAEIDEHMALEEKSRKRGVAVEIRRLESAWQTHAGRRRPSGPVRCRGGTLAGFGMNILRAEAFANRRGLVLDTFTFADPMRTLELNPTEVDRLRCHREGRVAGKLDVRELLRNRPKPVLPSRKARIAPRVRSIPKPGHRHPDRNRRRRPARPALRPGLRDLGQRGNIEVVLIDTQAHKAIDVFYVTAGGEKLAAEKQELLAEALRAAVG